MRGRPVSSWLEALLALGLGLLLAVVTRRPQELASTVPGLARDPLQQTWSLAWPAHAVTGPGRLFDGNVFAPLDNTLAFSDALLGYLPFGLVGDGPGAALVRYNVLLLLAFGLAFAGTWVLVRQLGLGRTAALLAATAYAFSPYRVSPSTTSTSCRAAASRSHSRCSPAATACGCAPAADRCGPDGPSPGGRPRRGR